MTSDNPLTSAALTPRHHSRHGWGLTRAVLGRLLRCLDEGHLTIITPTGERIEHRASATLKNGRSGEAVVVIHRWRAIKRLAMQGDLGFAQSYMDGDWSSPDLTAFMAMAAHNGERFERMIAGWGPVRLLNRWRHWRKANSKTGSRRNIAYHYDLGNAFYDKWLDPSMTYSSAIYANPQQSLEAAQANKLNRIVDRLDIRPGDQVLEIGCGWGALATRLAQSGASVTGLTLSTEQLAHAQALVAGQGLSQHVDLRLQDYRDCDGQFDRIVSIEMFEAVGESYWPVYFETLKKRLKPGGRAVLQVITIDESRFETYRRTPDFIQRYIFPGGMLPTKSILAEQATRAGLRLADRELFAASYALTLAEWRRRFLAAWPAIEAMGFPPSFREMWVYYLCYCEAGFQTGAIDVGLYVLEA